MNKIKPEHVRKFVALTKKLDSLMDEIVAYCPEAHVYIESEDAHLMDGPDHIESSPGIWVSAQENIVKSVPVRRIGGGAW